MIDDKFIDELIILRNEKEFNQQEIDILDETITLLQGLRAAYVRYCYNTDCGVSISESKKELANNILYLLNMEGNILHTPNRDYLPI